MAWMFTFAATGLRKLERERPGISGVWSSRQIAKRDLAGGLSPETVRKRMKK